jgi:biopolymer transport protein ExbD/biopolymer transport protein TolR
VRTLSRNAFRPQPVMNVTPLVDVVLVLLIVFMIVIPMMEKSAKVDLPAIFNPDPDPKGKTDPFTLSLTADGSMYFEQERLDEAGFNEALRAANQREPSRRLVLRADWAAKYSDVRKLFSTCQELGFPGVSLRVNEAKGPKTKP